MSGLNGVVVTLTNKESPHQVLVGNFQMKSKDGYSVTMLLTRYPTGNCQLSSIGYLNCLLTRKWTKEVNVACIKECYRLLGMDPKLILVDVNKSLIPDVEKLFSTVVAKNPYTSTNGSEM